MTSGSMVTELTCASRPSAFSCSAIRSAIPWVAPYLLAYATSTLMVSLLVPWSATVQSSALRAGREVPDRPISAETSRLVTAELSQPGATVSSAADPAATRVEPGWTGGDQ